MPEGQGKSDVQLRTDALAVLAENRHGVYTVPAIGLYPYQWCWDTGPIVLGWASVGEWDQAWGELDKLFSAQWPSGMVPHIVFWEQSDDYFPGPEVWSTGREPATTGLTQPPLPVSAAARLFTADPDRDRAAEQIGLLWPRLVAWLAWIERARTGPHLAAVVVHPWESGMDNSPAWDEPLARHPRDLERAPRPARRRHRLRQAAPVDEGVPPLPRHRRARCARRDGTPRPRWPTARSRSRTPRSPRSWGAPRPTSPPSPRPPGRTGATSPASPPRRVPASPGCGTRRSAGTAPTTCAAGKPTGPPTASGLAAMFGGANHDHARRMVEGLKAWSSAVKYSVPSSDPTDKSFDPIRYWRGPVWVLVNWLVADGMKLAGLDDDAEALRVETRALVEQGFTEYYDPRDGTGIGGHGFSWSAALTLDWLTKPTSTP